MAAIRSTLQWAAVFSESRVQFRTMLPHAGHQFAGEGDQIVWRSRPSIH